MIAMMPKAVMRLPPALAASARLFIIRVLSLFVPLFCLSLVSHALLITDRWPRWLGHFTFTTLLSFQVPSNTDSSGPQSRSIAKRPWPGMVFFQLLS
jgi:hypothetical protein